MKLSKSSLAGLLLTLVAVLASGCSGSSSPTSTPVDSLGVISITPANTAALTAGTQVTFTARLAYVLNSTATADIVIVIQDQAGHELSTTVPQPSVTVSRGSGNVDIGDHIALPATGVTAVTVYFPLLPTGSSTSTAIQSVAYTVH